MPSCRVSAAEPITHRMLTCRLVARPLRPADRRCRLEIAAVANPDAITGHLVEPIRLADRKPVVEGAGDADERHAGRFAGRHEVGRAGRGRDRAEATQFDPHPFGITQTHDPLDNAPLPYGGNDDEVDSVAHRCQSS
jgi:hypothetical protein